MSDNLGAIETEMPDDIQQAVERGQKIAAGRLAYNKWLLTGVWDGDVAHLLEYAKQAISEQNKTLDDVAEHESNLQNRLVELQRENEDLAEKLEFAERLRKDRDHAEDRVVCLVREVKHLEQDLENSDDALQSAHCDTEALVRTIRILARGK